MTSLELICSLEDMFVFQGVDVAQSENQSEQRARSGPSRKKRKLKAGVSLRSDAVLSPGDAVL